MMNIRILPLGDYQTNTYIVYEENAGACAVIDPGYEADTVLNTLRGLGLRLDAVLLTHGHFDHVGAVEALVEATGCRLWMHEADWSQFPSPLVSHLYPLANCDFAEVQFCEEGQVISAGGLEFTVWHTPGHSWGSVCYVCGDAIFAGDTLFAGSCGRTDLPGGDGRTMADSLARLARVTGEYRVYPGHGSASTLSREKKYNPYLR